MTKEEAIKDIRNAFVKDYADKIIKALEQEPWDDEYIKVPKKALKYRTAGMVAYNAEWLKNHFDIERAVICGAQQQKWIPVSERLPEIHQDVLLSLRSLDVVVGFRAETESYFYSQGDYIEPQNVLAWMPLPKPYGPQKSEDKE